MFRVSGGRRSGLPVVGFGHMSHHALVFLLLALRGRGGEAGWVNAGWEVAGQPVMQLVHTLFVSNNYPSFHLWRNKNLVKYQKV